MDLTFTFTRVMPLKFLTVLQINGLIRLGHSVLYTCAFLADAVWDHLFFLFYIPYVTNCELAVGIRMKLDFFLFKLCSPFGSHS